MQFTISLALFSLALAAPIAPKCPTSCSRDAKYSTLQYRLKKWESSDATCPGRDANIDMCKSYIAYESECKWNDTDRQLHMKIDFWSIHRDQVDATVGNDNIDKCQRFLDETWQDRKNAQA